MAPTGISKGAQVTFGVTLVAVLAISFWEEVTDMRLLRTSNYGQMENQNYRSLDQYMDKYDEGELEEWDFSPEWGVTEDELDDMTLSEEYWQNDDDMFGDEMMWGEDEETFFPVDGEGANPELVSEEAGETTDFERENNDVIEKK